jgi:hypothetical protein
MEPTKILDLPMGTNDADAETVRDYLKALLDQLWADGEGFSGKRPFGNSGWEWDLYRALVKGGAVQGTIDEYGDVTGFDQASATSAVFDAIDALK